MTLFGWTLRLTALITNAAQLCRYSMSGCLLVRWGLGEQKWVRTSLWMSLCDVCISLYPWSWQVFDSSLSLLAHAEPKDCLPLFNVCSVSPCSSSKYTNLELKKHTKTEKPIETSNPVKLWSVQTINDFEQIHFFFLCNNNIKKKKKFFWFIILLFWFNPTFYKMATYLNTSLKKKKNNIMKRLFLNVPCSKHPVLC